MRLLVVAVGKLKDAGLEAACAEYVKRSRALLPIERAVTRDAAASWQRATKARGPVVLLDERGETPDTAEFAGWLRHWRDDGVRQLSFLIGDAHGFDDDDRARADRVLALSRLTMPHRLAQLVLIEQLYRGAAMLAGHPYHHA